MHMPYYCVYFAEIIFTFDGDQGTEVLFKVQKTLDLVSAQIQCSRI